jgi:drug/metabolite transporter (DMT)-like permease
MESPARSVGRATVLIVISAIGFGSISVLTVLSTGTGAPLITVMAWRFVIAAILLGIGGIGAQRSAWQLTPGRRILQLIMIGGFGQTLITYLSLRALDYIPVAPLAFLFYTYPAWVAIIAAIRRSEKLTPIRIMALALALTGVAVMLGAPTDNLNPLGVVLAIGSSMIYAVYLPTLEHLQERVPPMFATFLLITGAATGFLLAGVFANELFLPRIARLWVDILLLAVVSTVIAFSSLIRGLAILGPVRTSIVATIEPFFTTVLGVLVLRNQLGVSTIVGGSLIAIAILVIEWSSTRSVPALE